MELSERSYELGDVMGFQKTAEVPPLMYSVAPSQAISPMVAEITQLTAHGDVRAAGALAMPELLPTAEDLGDDLEEDYFELPDYPEDNDTDATFGDFNELCKEQGAALHPDIRRAGLYAQSSLMWSREPNGYLSAIAEMGQQLRTLSNEPITTALVDLPASHQALREAGSPSHVLEGIFVDMLNATLEPVDNPRLDRAFSSTSERDCSVCDAAEPQWARVFAQMQIGEDAQLPDVKGPLGYQIIEDDAGQAVAVRKAIGVRSTMVVAEGVTIDGIPVPPGSLLHAEAAGDELSPATGEVSADSVPRGVHSSLHSTVITHATLMRLSSFVIGPDDRQDVFPGLDQNVPNGLSQQARTALFELSAQDLQLLSQTALERIRQRG